MRSFIAVMALSTSTIALVGLGAPAYAQAQPEAPAPEAEAVGAELGEIVVTARRREERLQDVPVAVTALSGAAIAAKGVNNAIELARVVPNVTIGGGSTNPQLLTVGARGIRQKEPHTYFDQSVVTIFADAVIPHPYGFGDTMYDIQNVQILKGPQGTLFGRNSPAGALIITPNYASIEDGFTGSVSASIGDYNRQKYNLVMNIPVNDWAAVRIAAEHFERNGYVKNVLNGDKWNSVGNDSIRLSVTLKPNDRISNYTVVDYLEEASSPYAIIPVEYLTGGSAVLVGGAANNQRLVAQQKGFGPWRFASHAFTGITPQDSLNQQWCAPGSARPFTPRCNRDFDKSTWLRTFGVVNRTEMDLGFGTLKNIASYRRAKRDSFQGSWNVAFADGSGGPGNHSITGSPDSPVESITEELQLSGRSFDDRLNWTTGAFYLHERARETNYSFQSIGLAASTSANVAPSWIRTNSWGVYGQGTFAVTDKLNLTAGVRYSSDQKKVWRSDTSINTVTGALTCNLFDANNVRLPANPALCMLRGDETWDAITWNFSADYDIAPGSMVYGTVSRGYRSGSFFPRAIRASLFDYDPEFITNFEAGLKSDWRLAGRPIRTNLAVYLAKQTDMQVQVQDATTTPLSGYINNAGKSQYWGGEFETTFRPTDELTLSGYASYTDFKYKKYLDDNGTDLSYQTPPQPISHWNLGASAEYRVPLDSRGALVVRGDVSWTSKVVTANDFPNLKGDWNQPAYTLVNVRADLEDFMGKGVDLGIWVTNLTNEWYSWGGTCLNGSCFAVPSPPRMFGVDVKYSF